MELTDKEREELAARLLHEKPGRDSAILVARCSKEEMVKWIQYACEAGLDHAD